MTDTNASPEPRIAVVGSRFNVDVTNGLLAGARASFADSGINLSDRDIYSAPGAIEIPMIAQTLAGTGSYDEVICLGCVIKGDTAHLEYISQAASAGLMAASLATCVPLTFGILTTYAGEQAMARSREDAHKKGGEATLVCLEALATLRSLAH
jgi:6,7-dimethyl-8-ribityllumazine synthase